MNKSVPYRKCKKMYRECQKMHRKCRKIYQGLSYYAFIQFFADSVRQFRQVNSVR